MNTFIAFTSNDSNHNLLVTSSDGNGVWSSPTLVHETTTLGLTYASFNNVMYIAFKSDDSNNKLLLVSSSDNGATWGAVSQVDNQTTQSGPSMASVNGSLYMAFRSNDSSNRILLVSSTDGQTWGDLSTAVNQSTNASPSITAFNGNLYIAFKSNDSSNKLLVTWSQDGGNTWQPLVITGQYTGIAPSITSYNNNLYIAFKSNDDSNKLLVISSLDGKTWSQEPTLTGQTTSATPSIAVSNNELLIAFKSNDSGHRLLTTSSADGIKWGQPIITGQSTGGGIAVCELVANTLVKVDFSYQLLNLIYSPPGAYSGGIISTAGYAQSSSTGSTVSTTQAFTNTTSLYASVGVAGNDASTDYSFTTSESKQSSLCIEKTASYTLSVAGPNADGINHDNDLYYLWLKPNSDSKQLLGPSIYTNINNETQIATSWSYYWGDSDMAMNIQYVYGSWLKYPSTMPAAVKTALDTAGLTTDDYAEILSTNPFSTDANASIDPNRYAITTWSFPYEPPKDANSAPAPVQSYSVSSNTTRTQTNESTFTYDVSYSVSESAETELFTASIGGSESFTWSNSVSNSVESGTGQAATVSIGCPSYDYTGPTNVLVYWDTICSSFMFAFAQVDAMATGEVTDGNGQLVVGQYVSLNIDGLDYHTYTNSRGIYNFFGNVQTQIKGTLTICDYTQDIEVGCNEPMANIQMTQ